ncbi:unnamed protein product [Lota lota]
MATLNTVGAAGGLCDQLGKWRLTTTRHSASASSHYNATLTTAFIGSPLRRRPTIRRTFGREQKDHYLAWSSERHHANGHMSLTPGQEPQPVSSNAVRLNQCGLRNSAEPGVSHGIPH